jgi:23S rRNA U2552 (ribose-2'-O)-methylase RlmE/FtsJ
VLKQPCHRVNVIFLKTDLQLRACSTYLNVNLSTNTTNLVIMDSGSNQYKVAATAESMPKRAY